MNIMTLWDAMIKGIIGDIDLYDYAWDWAVASGVDIYTPEEEMDGYAKAQKWIAQHIMVDTDTVGSYAIECNASDMMWKYREVFDPFLEKHNKYAYRPSTWKHLDPDEDDGFYEVYMCSLESLIVGSYSDKDYEELYRMLSAKNYPIPTINDYPNFFAHRGDEENRISINQYELYRQADEDVKDLWKEI